MSDDDFMLEDAADEDYDFEYEDDEEAEDGDIDIENQYYQAKGLKEDDPAAAIEEFKAVIKQEEEKSDWGFKAHKQVIKLYFKQGDRANTIEYYKELLKYTKNAVTRNVSEKSINNILDSISSDNDMAFMEEFYRITLQTLEETKNDRLWLKTNLKLAKLWLDRKEYLRLTKILKELHAACQRSDGSDDQSRGTYLLEVYALEIQMYTETKNNKKLKELYNKTSNIKSAIPHPRIMGIIRECGGKMHMGEEQWDKAQTDFFESFKNYDEAGSLQRIQVLKYVVLANMLMDSQINPFESQETKPYASHPEIAAMTDLVNAYQGHEIHEFERILRNNKKDIMGDPFIRHYIDDVLKNIRSQVLLKMIKPYTRISTERLARSLKISPREVEELLVSLILDEKLNGRIDQTAGRLELDVRTKAEIERCNAMANWSGKLEKVWDGSVAKV